MTEKLELIMRLVNDALNFNESITAMYHIRTTALEMIKGLIEETHIVVFCENCNTPYSYEVDKKPDVITCTYCEEVIKND